MHSASVKERGKCYIKRQVLLFHGKKNNLIVGVTALVFREIDNFEPAIY